jgi:polyhydroxybutyrate depolymerase
MEPGLYVFTLDHGGMERTYDLMIPSGYVSTEPMPLLLNLHPFTLGGPWLHEFWARVSNFNSKGDREGFLVVQPDGTGTPVSWNGGDECCSPPGTDIDDVDFIAAVIDAVQNQICVDERRVVATGMSNGAYLAYRIACEVPDMLAAIAPVVGSLSTELTCSDGRAVPVLQLSGSEDSLDRRERSVARFLEINGCNDTTEMTYRQGDVTCTTHTACEEEVEVTHCIVEGGGHCFFGDSDFLLSLVGCEVRDDIVSQDLIWEFLSRWRLP